MSHPPAGRSLREHEICLGTESMVEASLLVTNEVGLHARPAALFVQAANRFRAGILVRNLSTRSDAVDAKSILGVLTLGVLRGHEILVSADGPDEADAIEALRRLVARDFDEVGAA